MERCSSQCTCPCTVSGKPGGCKVNYPGLTSSPWHDIADKQLHGGYGAIITIRVGKQGRICGDEQALATADSVEQGRHKERSSCILNQHSMRITAERVKLDANVYDDMIRISVRNRGDVEDLIEDFRKALKVKQLRNT